MCLLASIPWLKTHGPVEPARTVVCVFVDEHSSAKIHGLVEPARTVVCVFVDEHSSAKIHGLVEPARTVVCVFVCLLAFLG